MFFDLREATTSKIRESSLAECVLIKLSKIFFIESALQLGDSELEVENHCVRVSMAPAGNDFGWSGNSQNRKRNSEEYK